MPDISVNRTTYIKIGSASPITTGIAEGSMLIDRVLFAEDFKFGQFASSRFEIQIYGINNVAGQNIEVYQLENSVRTDLFVGQIESSKLDNAGYYRDIIAYDKFYFIAKKNVADWFNGLWANNTEISVLDAFKSLLAYFDIDYDTNTVVAANFSGTLYKTSVPSFEKISFKDMVKFLLEPLALIPYINASGDVAVFAPSMANSVNLVGKYDKNESVFEEYEVLPMQWVGIANIDSAILAQEEITGNTSDIRYDLPYNPIRLDLYVEDAETAQESVLEDFISKASFDVYTPCEVFMIVSDMSIKLGDKITTTRGTSYVSEMILSGPMLIEQQLISRGSQVQQEVEEEYDPVFAYLDNRVTEAAEDLQQQLDDFQPSDEYLEKVGEFSDTIAGGMGLQVITYKAQDGSLLKYFYAPPPAGSAVTGISGSNFIFTMKSTGFAWTNKWEGAPDASSESHVDPGTGDTVSTQWTSGISANGNALLKILNAYKVSADIINTGELVIKDQQGTIIHKFSYNDLSALIGGASGISYSTNGANANKIVLGSDVIISGDVTIGGLADIVGDAVEDAVGDLSLNGIDHQVTTYSTSSSNTEPPQIPSGYTSFYTYFFATSSDTYLAPYPSNSSSWKTSPSLAGYSSSNYTTNNLFGCTYYVYSGGTTKSSVTHLLAPKGTLYTGETTTLKLDVWRNTIMSASAGQYLWTRVQTYYTDNPTVVGNTAYSVARQGSNGSSGANVYIKYSANSDGSNMTDTPNENTQYIGVYNGLQATIPSNPSSYSWSKYVGVDGNQVFIRYSANSNGSSMTETPQSNTQYIGIYSGSATSAPTSYTQYSWTKIKGEQGNSGVGIDHTTVTYGIGSSGTSSSGVTFSSTIPDISLEANKGKYLWTKTDIYYTSAPNTVAKTAYSVAYIADDGAPGSDGVGISSITQYFYPSTSNAVAQIPAIGSSSWKDAPSKFTGDNAFSASKPYLWTYTHTLYSNNSTSNSERYILGVWGQDGQDGSGSGAQGRGISAITPQYYLSTSNSTQTGGSWSDSPQAYSYYPSASGSKSQGSYSDAITGLSLSSGTTYTVKWKYNPSVNYYTQIAITNSSNTNLKYIDTPKNKTSGSFEYTPTSNYSNAKVRIQSSATSISSYEVTIMGAGLETKKYYWQRDKIDWDDNSASTYTTPVLISALNKAIWDANEANAAIGLWCYENDVTHIDGGKIYTGSITTDKLSAGTVAANEAFIEMLMANHIDVEGNQYLYAPDSRWYFKGLTEEQKLVIESLAWGLSVQTIQQFNQQPNANPYRFERLAVSLGGIYNPNFIYYSNEKYLTEADQTPVYVPRAAITDMGFIVGRNIGKETITSELLYNRLEQDCLILNDDDLYTFGSSDLDPSRSNEIGIYSTSAQIPGGVRTPWMIPVMLNTSKPYAGTGNFNIPGAIAIYGGLNVFPYTYKETGGTTKNMPGDMYVAGNLTVGGTINGSGGSSGGGYEVLYATVSSIPTNGAYSSTPVDFTRTYSSAPTVFLSLDSVSPDAVVQFVPTSVTTTGFTLLCRSINASQSCTAAINIMVIP